VKAGSWNEYAPEGEMIGKLGARFCALFLNRLPRIEGGRGLTLREALREVQGLKPLDFVGAYRHD
jgi:hypothetical protein